MIKNTDQKKHKADIGRVFFSIAPRVIKVSPVLFLLDFILNLIDGTLSGSMIYFTQQFLEKAQGLVEHRNGIKTVIYAMILWGLSQLLWQIINGVAYLINMMYVRRKASYHWRFKRK